MGRHVSPPKIFFAIGEAQRRRDYSGIRVPVLSISDGPRRIYDPALDHYQVKSDADRKPLEAFGSLIADYVEGWRARLKAAVPDAQIIDLPGSGHYIFMTREAEVLRGIDDFAARMDR
jgi:pimeloyl-ACP methyl ester carboxylesterase